MKKPIPPLSLTSDSVVQAHREIKIFIKLLENPPNQTISKKMEALKSKVDNFLHHNAANSSSLSGKGKTVLVTGAGGFIAAHVLNAFLSRGYHVRATVRSASSAEKVRKTHNKYADLLDFATVEDIQLPGALDEAVKGVDGVGFICGVF